MRVLFGAENVGLNIAGRVLEVTVKKLAIPIKNKNSLYRWDDETTLRSEWGAPLILLQAGAIHCE